MDLVGPLPETPRGHKYIMTLTDYYTKWAEALALKDKSASSVADVLYSVSLQAILNSCLNIQSVAENYFPSCRRCAALIAFGSYYLIKGGSL